MGSRGGQAATPRDPRYFSATPRNFLATPFGVATPRLRTAVLVLSEAVRTTGKKFSEFQAQMRENLGGTRIIPVINIKMEKSKLKFKEKYLFPDSDSD